MKTMLFNGRVENKNLNRKINLDKVGLNTGNMLFWYSLANTLDVECHTSQECAWKKVDMEQYRAFITTDVIWIQENTEVLPLKSQFSLVGDRPLIPISVGLQCHAMKSDFHIHEETVKLLKAIQERAILGVRGQYTAEILNKHGITNLQVIGCPSMYLPFDYNFTIRKVEHDIKNVNITMRSLYSSLSQKEKQFLVYAANRSYDFCEQTSHVFSPKLCSDDALYEYLNGWLNMHKMMFFDVNDWRSYMSTMDFSMGCRFHGNVVGLWEGVPALFIPIDSRTTELSNHFHLPTMKLDEFDPEKDIRYYYDLADYTEFNKNYANRLDEYITFLKKNHLPIKKRVDDWYDRRIGNL